MSMTQRKAMTVDEFLNWENQQELKYEFDGFAPVAMTGGTQEHALIQINLTTALRVRLRGGPCRVEGSGQIYLYQSVFLRPPGHRDRCEPIELVLQFLLILPVQELIHGHRFALGHAHPRMIARAIAVPPAQLAERRAAHKSRVSSS